MNKFYTYCLSFICVVVFHSHAQAVVPCSSWNAGLADIDSFEGVSRHRDGRVFGLGVGRLVSLEGGLLS
ncbi:MAG: hypothetical protein ACRBBJ_13715 [Rhodomicrobiaceae bacterium]